MIPRKLELRNQKKKDCSGIMFFMNWKLVKFCLFSALKELKNWRTFHLSQNNDCLRNIRINFKLSEIKVNNLLQSNYYKLKSVLNSKYKKNFVCTKKETKSKKKLKKKKKNDLKKTKIKWIIKRKEIRCECRYLNKRVHKRTLTFNWIYGDLWSWKVSYLICRTY